MGSGGRWFESSRPDTAKGDVHCKDGCPYCATWRPLHKPYCTSTALQRRCLMIRTTAFEARQRQERLDAKTLDNLFRRRIEEGAKCSPFVSAAILQTVKEVFPLHPEDFGTQLDLGQIKLLVAAAHEPAGKSLEQCQKVTVLLPLDAPEDWPLRAREGVTALRRSRILRLTTEALDQGGLLCYEDLAYRLLNCGVRTIVRDIAALRRRGLAVPSRGQQQ